MKNTKWYLFMVVLLLGAFALAACGGTTEQPAATEAAPVVEPTAEPVMEEPTEMPAMEERLKCRPRKRQLWKSRPKQRA